MQENPRAYEDQQQDKPQGAGFDVDANNNNAEINNGITNGSRRSQWAPTKRLEPTMKNNADKEFASFAPNLHHSQKKSFSPKFIFAILLVLGFGTLLYGFLSLTKQIHSPFLANEQTTTEQTDAESLQKILQMQSTDTDQDGISDYDEEYVYGTSAYLADTDSDGYLDKQEIDSGNDPLCPAGTDCRGVETEQVENGENAEENAPLDNTTATTTGAYGLPSEMINEMKNLNAEQVRALLLESGTLTKEQLQEIDDETLMSVFKEALGQE